MKTFAKTTGRTIGTAILIVCTSPLLPAVGLMHLLASAEKEQCEMPEKQSL